MARKQTQTQPEQTQPEQTQPEQTQPSPYPILSERDALEQAAAHTFKAARWVDHKAEWTRNSGGHIAGLRLDIDDGGRLFFSRARNTAERGEHDTAPAITADDSVGGVSLQTPAAITTADRVGFGFDPAAIGAESVGLLMAAALSAAGLRITTPADAAKQTAKQTAADRKAAADALRHTLGGLAITAATAPAAAIAVIGQAAALATAAGVSLDKRTRAAFASALESAADDSLRSAIVAARETMEQAEQAEQTEQTEQAAE